MNVLRKLLVLLIPLVLVTACATTKETATAGGSTETAPLGTTTEQAPTTEGGAATSEATGEAESMGMSGESGFQGDELANPDSLLAKRKIYFDFDKSEIKQEFLPVL